MTAERWWVRWAARWLARVDGVSGQLRLAMLILTGLSTATMSLRQYGHGEYAWPLIATVGAGSLVFTYLYTEGGVWNQVSRDRKDLSDNYSGPTMLLHQRIGARQLALLGYLIQDGSQLSLGEIEERMQDVTEQEWSQLRRGVDIEELEMEQR